MLGGASSIRTILTLLLRRAFTLDLDSFAKEMGMAKDGLKSSLRPFFVRTF